jgi:hypothetical protein
MLISRSRFFLLLFLVLVGPFFLPKLFWFAGSRTVVGWVYYTSGELDNLDGTKKSLIIRFPLGKDTIEFRGMYFPLRDNAPVRVRYWRFDAFDARIDLPVCIWGDTLVNSLLPLGIWLVLLLTPNRFDPLIPWGCKVWLRWRWPPVRVVPAVALGASHPEIEEERSGLPHG